MKHPDYDLWQIEYQYNMNEFYNPHKTKHSRNAYACIVSDNVSRVWDYTWSESGIHFYRSYNDIHAQ